MTIFRYKKVLRLQKFQVVNLEFRRKLQKSYSLAKFTTIILCIKFFFHIRIVGTISKFHCKQHHCFHYDYVSSATNVSLNWVMKPQRITTMSSYGICFTFSMFLIVFDLWIRYFSYFKWLIHDMFVSQTLLCLWMMIKHWFKQNKIPD